MRETVFGQRAIGFTTAEVAKLADVSPRQLQLWEEKRVVVASRSGRVRLYSSSQVLFVTVLGEFRKRGLSFQRIRALSTRLYCILSNEFVRQAPGSFVLSDGRQIQFADSPNKTLELVSNFFRPIVCVDLAGCLERIEKARLAG